MVFMSRYAKDVIGMESLRSRYKHAQARGLNVVVGDYHKDPIPDVDVYYFWPDNGMADNERLVKRLLVEKSDVTIIVAGDKAVKSEDFQKRAVDAGLSVSYMDTKQYVAHWDEMEKQLRPLIAEIKAAEKKN